MFLGRKNKRLLKKEYSNVLKAPNTPKTGFHPPVHIDASLF